MKRAVIRQLHGTSPMQLLCKLWNCPRGTLWYHPCPAAEADLYAAPAYVEQVEQRGVRLSMALVGAAWQNGYAERVIRTIKEEEVALSEYRDFHDASNQIGQFIDEVYAHKRIHSSLGYLTPAEFEQHWCADNPRDLSTAHI